MTGWSESSTLAERSAGSTALARNVALCALLLLAAVAWFANIAYRTLTEPDEGRYAEIPREMLASGDWVTPHLNAIPYLEKPPLQYWATAVTYTLFGLSPWASRLWAAGLGLLGIVVTYLIGRSLWGYRAALFAALIMASCPLYFIVAHINTLDTGLAFFMNAGLACFVMAQRAPMSSSLQRRWMWLCWGALACGFLQKGLVALVLPPLTLGIYSLVHRDVRLWKRLHLLDGAAIVAVLTLPWLILASQRTPGFLQFFFVHEHLQRFTSDEARRSEPWWYFLVILCVGVIPWITLIARAALARVQSHQALHIESLLLIWAITIVSFFSLSASKLAPYIVAAIAPLALLGGRWLDRHGTSRTLWPAAIMAGLLCLLLLWSHLVITHTMEPGIKQITYLQISQWARAAGAICLIGVAACLFFMRAENLSAAIIALAGGFTVALAVLMCGTNAMELLRGRRDLAAIIAPRLSAETAFYCVGMYWQVLPFTLQRTCTQVEYHGELEVQFASGPQQWIPDMRDFVAQWNTSSRDALAIVKPDVWPRVQAAGVHATPIINDDNLVVIVKP